MAAKGFDSTFSRIIERVIHTRRRTSNDQQMVVKVRCADVRATVAIDPHFFAHDQWISGSFSSIDVCSFFQLSVWFVLPRRRSQVAPSFHFCLLVFEQRRIVGSWKDGDSPGSLDSEDSVDWLKHLADY